LRDREKAAKAESDRLRREISNLTSRNAELAEMVRQQQSDGMQRAAPTGQRGYQAADAEDREQETAVKMGRKRDEIADSTTGLARAKDAQRERDIETQRRNAERLHEEELLKAQKKRDEANEIRRQREIQEARDAQLEQLQLDRERRSNAAAHTRLPNTIPTTQQFLGDTEMMPEEDPNDTVTARNTGPEGKTERQYRSGKREVHYSNGTRKIMLPSGHVTLRFNNGDVKRIFPSGKTTYWYEVAQTLHTQLPDGVQVFEFRTRNQCEKHYPDGTKEILYQDVIYKIMFPDGNEETMYPDGGPLRR